MPGVSEKTALDVMKKAMQSDSKTDQKNKQSQVMLRDKHGKVDRDNLVYQQLYLKERAKCLQDVRKCEIELNFLRDNMAKQGGPDPDRGYLGGGGGPGRIAERKSPVQISNEVFSSAMNKGRKASWASNDDEGEQGDRERLKEQLKSAHVRRMQLLQKEHDKQVYKRLVRFAETLGGEDSRMKKKKSIQERWAEQFHGTTQE